MKTIKIKFTDMPSEFDINNNFVVDILKARYNVEMSDEPDFLFYSVFGIKYLNYKNCVRVFFAGEPIVPNFNDCDYAVGYIYMTFGDRYLRAAGVLANSDGSEIPKSIQDRSKVADKMFDRKFCNFVYSNAVNGDGAKLRVDFCKQLMQYKHVDCPGKVLNNMTDLIAERYENVDGKELCVTSNKWQTSKVNFQSDYKFSISFENLKISGMTTEKLINPFIAYSIPIYWGNPDVAKEYNPKAFINCNDYDNDFERVIERVKELDNDKEQYLEMLRQSPLLNTFDFEQRSKLNDYIYGIIERGNHPVRNPCAVEIWEPISANMILRWGDNYADAHDMLGACNGTLWKLFLKLRKIGNTSAGRVLKRYIKFILKLFKIV